jgi:dUTP pyrophosphatase
MYELKYVIDPECPIAEPIKAPAYDGDVGYDLGVAISEAELILSPHGFIDLPTYVRVEMPHGIWGDIRPRSSTFARRHLVVMGGTIDNGYRGLLSVFVYNPNPVPVTISQGDYLAQLVLCPIIVPPLKRVENISPSLRGAKGFGSSGGFQVQPRPSHSYQGSSDSVKKK